MGTHGCHGNWYLIPNYGCFLFKLEETKKWMNAQKFCEDHGGYLPEITDSYQQESLNAFVHVIAGKSRTFWMGGNDIGDEGQWRWIHSGNFHQIDSFLMIL